MQKQPQSNYKSIGAPSAEIIPLKPQQLYLNYLQQIQHYGPQAYHSPPLTQTHTHSMTSKQRALCGTLEEKESTSQIWYMDEVISKNKIP